MDKLPDSITTINAITRIIAMVFVMYYSVIYKNLLAFLIGILYAISLVTTYLFIIPQPIRLTITTPIAGLMAWFIIQMLRKDASRKYSKNNKKEKSDV